jgi:hypothetical protein
MSRAPASRVHFVLLALLTSAVLAVLSVGGCAQILGADNPHPLIVDAGSDVSIDATPIDASDGGHDAPLSCQSTCPGCCDTDGGCHLGDTFSACGTGGASCSVCAGEACNFGHCGGCLSPAECDAGPSPTCNMGVCNYTLYTYDGQPFSIAVDDTSVYWVDFGNGSVFKVPIGGGAVATLYSNGMSAQGISLDSSNVYWTDTGAGTVMKVSKDGGTIVTLASSQVGPIGVALGPNDKTVYWGDSTGTTAHEWFVAYTAIKGGGTVSTFAPDQAAVWLTVDTENAYWTVEGTYGSVVQKQLKGGYALTLAYPVDAPRRVTVDKTNVYWTAAGAAGGAVQKITIGEQAAKDSPPDTLASGQMGAHGIAIDPADEYVYWTNKLADGGSVQKVSIDGGVPTTLATRQVSPAGVAVDSTYVYWVDFGSGAVMKAPR